MPQMLALLAMAVCLPHLAVLIAGIPRLLPAVWAPLPVTSLPGCAAAASPVARGTGRYGNPGRRPGVTLRLRRNP